MQRDGRELASWDVTVLADRPPTADWSEPPGQSARSLQTRLPWEVSRRLRRDRAQAELRLSERPAAPPLVIAIPLPGGSPKSAKGVSLQDLTAHPWAGLTVTARLVARDAPGATGTSADATFILPERSFQNPLARLLIAVRKQLSLHPDDRNAALAQLDPILSAPDVLADDYGAYLNLAGIYYLLALDRSDAAVTEAQDRLWQLALHLEEGVTERTARALEAARQAAREALERALQNPSPENRAELDKKLQELENAIQRHMDALADQARRSDDEMPYDQRQRRLDSQAMQDKADAARDAAREGRMDDAKREMAELEKMLEAAAQRPGGSRPEQQAQRREAPARPPADRRGAGHDRARGQAARPRPKPRRSGQRCPANPAGTAFRRAAGG